MKYRCHSIKKRGESSSRQTIFCFSLSVSHVTCYLSVLTNVSYVSYVSRAMTIIYSEAFKARLVVRDASLAAFFILHRNGYVNQIIDWTCIADSNVFPTYMRPYLDAIPLELRSDVKFNIERDEPLASNDHKKTKAKQWLRKWTENPNWIPRKQCVDSFAENQAKLLMWRAFRQSIDIKSVVVTRPITPTVIATPLLTPIMPGVNTVIVSTPIVRSRKRISELTQSAWTRRKRSKNESSASPHSPYSRDDIFEVDTLLDVRSSVDGTKEYKVRWKNYAPEFDTWEVTFISKFLMCLFRGAGVAA